MTYTPINWQTGDTITAEKLNKMDNGWGVSSTQLFSETVTTTENNFGLYGADLAYSQLIDANTIIVTFDGTDYTCPSIAPGEYGAPYNDGNPDFSVFPFNLYTNSDGDPAYLNTQTAGEHTITVVVLTLQVSSDFTKAASAAIGGAFYQLVVGTTTWRQVVDAMLAGKLVFISKGVANDHADFLLVTKAYIDSNEVYTVAAIVVSNGALTIVYHRASTADGALS